MARRARPSARRASRDRSGAFARAESGAVLAWLAILVPVLLGLGTLAVDLSRLFSLQTQLQNAADALALAGAAELNGANTSIARSTSAINNLVVNNQRFGANGPAQVAVSSIRFLQSLPASDAIAISSANITTDPTAARYVEVQVSPVSMNFILPFFSGIANATTGARATAGLREALCQSTPMFICNPWEGTSTSLTQAANDPAQLRRLIDLKAGGGGSNQYTSGNYGFLQVPIGNGASALQTAVAQVSPTVCASTQDGVSLRPGQVTYVDRGFNVRFDQYGGSMNSARSDPNFRPARDVMTFPRDSCFSNNSCSPLGAAASRIGAGDWDFVAYMQANHGTITTATIGGVTYAINYSAHTFAPSNQRPSRYQVYRWEIDTNHIPNAGVPTHYSGGVLNDTPDRRLLYVAVLNCNALSAQGLMSGGNSGAPLPVQAYSRFFLTEQVNSDVYGEFNGIVEPGSDNGILHELVQLYR
ncbi:MAG: pilus assembly protein [Proteobacteria bacterium]|nr:pilus assembly protein [Pseudomonadota bacterium]